MGVIGMDGNLLRKMIICGANELTKNSRELDALNVFPVPDGDTGTNMSHTVQSAAREVYKLSTPNIHDVAKAASGGSLRGARGNSGVILSQLFRGFAKGLSGKAVATAEELADALAQAVETAYVAVMKPKEGTILTIARAISEQAYECAFEDEDIGHSLATNLNHANEVLKKTPTMLPALKQAAGEDAGGKGLIMIFKGAMDALRLADDPVPADPARQAGAPPTFRGAGEADIKFLYCTELLIDLKAETQADAEGVFKGFLPGLGDSIVVVADGGVMKVHVHTNHPGKVLEKAVGFGEINNIKIDNMRMQHDTMLEFSVSDTPKKPVGFVAVAAGGGMRDLFLGLGADRVIEGGQTMNPSAEDIAKAVAEVNADAVVILPNNKNIILTAGQAAKLTEAGKAAHVVPTRSIPQGVACMITYVDAATAEENIAAMNEAIQNVHSGQVTRAVRNSVVDGHAVREGDILCLYDGDIALVATDLQNAAKLLADHMLSFGGDVVSVYYGEGVTEDMAREIGGYISGNYPDSEVELYDGQQPLYPYILSVE
jgi:DAK2 domain fusion protein YloV